jgi:hypothetical protein
MSEVKELKYCPSGELALTALHKLNMKKLGQKTHGKSRRRIFHRELAVHGVGAGGGEVEQIYPTLRLRPGGYLSYLLTGGYTPSGSLLNAEAILPTSPCTV